MFRIDVLQQHFDELSRQENEYWSSLTAAVESIRLGFSSYLASDEQNKDQKQTQPKVSAGTYAADSGISNDLDDLPRVGRKLHFTLFLELAKDRSYHPESLMAFNLSVERKGGAQLVVVDLESSKEISSFRGLTQVYEYLYVRCKEKLSGLR